MRAIVVALLCLASSAAAAPVNCPKYAAKVEKYCIAAAKNATTNPSKADIKNVCDEAHDAALDMCEDGFRHFTWPVGMDRCSMLAAAPMWNVLYGCQRVNEALCGAWPEATSELFVKDCRKK